MLIIATSGTLTALPNECWKDSGLAAFWAFTFHKVVVKLAESALGRTEKQLKTGRQNGMFYYVCVYVSVFRDLKVLKLWICGFVCVGTNLYTSDDDVL